MENRLPCPNHRFRSNVIYELERANASSPGPQTSVPEGETRRATEQVEKLKWIDCPFSGDGCQCYKPLTVVQQEMRVLNIISLANNLIKEHAPKFELISDPKRTARMLVYAAGKIRQRSFHDERDHIILTGFEIEVLAIAGSIVLSGAAPLPTWMTKGTSFENKTRLDPNGVPDPPGSIYFVLESADAVDAWVEKNPDNLDGKAWQRLVNSGAVTTRGLDEPGAFFAQMLQYIDRPDMPPLFYEACRIVAALRDGTKFPYKRGPRDTTLMTRQARAAPVALGSYFKDLGALQLWYEMGNIEARVSQHEVINMRRQMLLKGYTDELLKIKSVKDAMFNLIARGRYCSIDRGAEGSIGPVTFKEAINELGEFDDAMDKIKDYPLVNLLMVPQPDTASLIKRATTLLTICSSSLFIYTDEVLVAMTGQWAKAKGDIKKPIAKYMSDDGVPLEFHPWDTDIGREIDEIFSRLTTPRDVAEQFIQNLTANSAGVTPEMIEELSADFHEVIKAVIGTKVGFIGAAAQHIDDIHMVTEAMRAPIMTFFRRQKGRRQRQVSGINAMTQLGFVGGRVLLTQAARMNREYAYAKAYGGAGDARVQMMGTGMSSGFCVSSDIKGFDSSLATAVQTYIRVKAVQLFKDYEYVAKTRNLFAFNSTDVSVVEYDASGVAIGPRTIRISPVAHAYMAASVEVPKYVLSGERKVVASHSTLASGTFDTSAIGSHVTAALAKAVQRKFPHLTPRGMGMGDDFVLSATSSHPKKDMVAVSEYINQALSEIGLEGAAVASTVFGEFLQVPAILGCIANYGHRLSVNTIERPTGRNAYEQFSAAASIFSEMVGRAFDPSRVWECMYFQMYVLSFMRVGDEFPLSNYTKKRGGRVFTKVPLLGLAIRYGAPLLSLTTSKKSIPVSSDHAFAGGGTQMQVFGLLFGFNSIAESIKFQSEMKETVIKDLRKTKGGYRKALRAYFRADRYSKTLFARRLDVEAFEMLRARDALIHASLNAELPKEALPQLSDEVSRTLNQLAHNINSLADRKKLVASTLAAASLAAKGVHVPNSVLYHMKALEKLRGAAIKKLRNEDYWRMVDSAMAENYARLQLKSDFRIVSSYFDDMMPVFDIGIDLGRARIKDARLATALRHAVPVPATMYGRGSRVDFFRRGEDLVNNSDLTTLDNALGFNYLDSHKSVIVKLVEDVSQLPDRNEAISQVASALNLSMSDEQAFRRLVNNSFVAGSGRIGLTIDNRRVIGMSIDSNQMLTRTAYPLGFTRKTAAVAKTYAGVIAGFESSYGHNFGSLKLRYHLNAFGEAMINHQSNNPLS